MSDNTCLSKVINFIKTIFDTKRFDDFKSESDDELETEEIELETEEIKLESVEIKTEEIKLELEEIKTEQIKLEDKIKEYINTPISSDSEDDLDNLANFEIIGILKNMKTSLIDEVIQTKTQTKTKID
jgi:hypothetical protein